MNTSKNSFLTRKPTTHLLLPFIVITAGFLSIGLQMLTLTPQVKQRINNYPNSNVRILADQGILIIRVVPNSPAARIGLRPGDVIRTINNQPVTISEGVQQILEKNGLNNSLQIQVLRNGQNLVFTVKPELLPSPNNIQP
ncbi:PDZ domain-containing protein [Nostoc punctiforme UO1]|uniref:PDZ domain-containing protein n=1 Tax=Nostoc punctiforme TaxID=272131 RepID=UPI0030B147CC